MLKSFILTILATLYITSLSVAQASVRIDGEIAAVSTYNPASERRCLEAFVTSRFTYAHNICLSLAQRGLREAQLVTGLMYAFGEGTKKDLRMARIWLREAVRNGSKEAKAVLADLNMDD